MASEDTAGQIQLPAAPTLAHIARLQADRCYRDAQGSFFAEGVRNFITAVDCQHPIAALVYSERLLTVPLARKLVRQQKRAGIPFARLSPEQFRSIARAERASGIGAVLRQNIQDLHHVSPGDRPCWVVLGHARALGNVGTLVRTAAAVGAAGFILLGVSVDPFDPALVRASMGALFRQAFVRATVAQLGAWVRQHSLLVIGASPDGNAPYNGVRYARPTVLLLGEERSGLSAEQRALCQQIVRIPMVAESDSLNLGVAGSLLMYEVLRATQSGA